MLEITWGGRAMPPWPRLIKVVKYDNYPHRNKSARAEEDVRIVMMVSCRHARRFHFVRRSSQQGIAASTVVVRGGFPEMPALLVRHEDVAAHAPAF